MTYFTKYLHSINTKTPSQPLTYKLLWVSQHFVPYDNMEGTGKWHGRLTERVITITLNSTEEYVHKHFPIPSLRVGYLPFCRVGYLPFCRVGYLPFGKKLGKYVKLVVKSFWYKGTPIIITRIAISNSFSILSLLMFFWYDSTNHLSPGGYDSFILTTW